MPIFQLKPILPKHIISSAQFTCVIKQAARKSIQAAERDVKSSVKTWKHKPDIVTIEEETSSAYSITTGTSDVIFGYVEEGTKAHVIRPKRSKYLRFFSDYRAKTRVGIIGSREGGASGEAVFRKSVYHPGTKARQFMLTISRRRQVTFSQGISAAIAKLTREQT